MGAADRTPRERLTYADDHRLAGIVITRIQACATAATTPQRHVTISMSSLAQPFRAARSALAIALAIAALMATLHASSPKFFQAATQGDFLKGDVENLSIDNHGQLTLGPATELVYETAAPFLWSIVPQPDGSLFVGTGNEGKVFRVDSAGKGSLFFD